MDDTTGENGVYTCRLTDFIGHKPGNNNKKNVQAVPHLIQNDRRMMLVDESR